MAISPKSGSQPRPPTADEVDTLYCSNFPAELKKRCDDMASMLKMSLTQFVAYILDEETKSVKNDVTKAREAVERWHETRKKSKLSE